MRARCRGRRTRRSGTPPVACAPPAGSRTACVGNRTYVVQDGDNLNSIARRLGTTNGRMLMLNPTLLPTDFSQAGTTICIP